MTTKEIEIKYYIGSKEITKDEQWYTTEIISVLINGIKRFTLERFIDTFDECWEIKDNGKNVNWTTTLQEAINNIRCNDIYGFRFLMNGVNE